MSTREGFRAHYEGYCGTHHDPIELGDLIMETPDAFGYSHVDCVESAQRQEERAPAAVCDQCFMEKPCPCDDGQ